MEETIDFVDANTIQDEDYSLYIILVLLGIIITIFLIKKRKGSSSAIRDKILLCGPNNTGKTSFFYSFISQKPIPLTVSSMAVNQFDKLEVKKDQQTKALTILDIPGIGYFQNKIIENIDSSRAIVVFVDSADKKCLNEASEFLYEIINHESFDDDLRLIIACNKSDNKFSKGKTIIESELNNEVDSKKLIKQKNNLEETIQVGKLFNLKAKFLFKMYSNISFVECTKEDNFSSLKSALVDSLF